MGLDLPPPVHMRPPEPDPPPCGHHKWMAPPNILAYLANNRYSLLAIQVRKIVFKTIPVGDYCNQEHIYKLW